jgi:hypothetical protein
MTPFDKAHRDWPQDLKRDRLTEIIKQVEPPVGLKEFDSAWESLAKDRPGIPAHRCPYRRALVKKFYNQLDLDD